VDFSMISQAEGLKFALEHFRRASPTALAPSSGN